MEAEVAETRYLEEYMKETGWGLFAKFVLGVACLCHLAQAVTFVTMAYTVALSRCEERPFPEANAMYIFTAYLIGSGFGNLIGSALSDRYGRRKYLTYGLMCVFFSSFTAAFSYTSYVVVTSTLILGVGSELNSTQIKLLLVESSNKERRGSMMMLCSFFWAAGYIMTIFLVILFETPTLLDVKRSAVQLTTWRIMFAVNGGIHLVIACVCAVLEESPRYYLCMGRTYLAFLLLKQLYAINKSSYAENFKVKEDDLKNIIPTYGLAYQEPITFWDALKRFLWKFWMSLKLMLERRFWRTTWILIAIKIPLVIFGLFQLNIFLAKQLSGGVQRSYKRLDFVYPVLRPMTYMDPELRRSSNMCQASIENGNFHKDFLVLGAAPLFGNLLGMLLVEKVGRKLILFPGILLTSCSFLTLTFIDQEIVRIAASWLVLVAAGCCISTVTVMSFELYPTIIRGTANGVTSFPGFILAAFVLNFVVTEEEIFTTIMGILYFCLAIFTCFLPELKGKPLVE